MTEKRIHTISFKATESENDYLKRISDSEGISTSEYLQIMIAKDREKKRNLYLHLNNIFGKVESK